MISGYYPGAWCQKCPIHHYSFISKDKLLKGGEIMVPVRIQVNDAHQHVQDGSALLVCAYDDAEKFSQNHLGGAISFQEFSTRKSNLDKNQEIIFYCA